MSSFDIKELYFCCSKYDIILSCMEDPAGTANAMKNFQNELDELVKSGAHNRGCVGYEELEHHQNVLRKILQEKFPRIIINF